MIRITVDLVSAKHPSRSRRLGAMHIANMGGYVNDKHADYVAQFVDKRGRTHGRPVTIMRHARLTTSVWQLVAKALLCHLPRGAHMQGTDDGHVVVTQDR